MYKDEKQSLFTKEFGKRVYVPQPTIMILTVPVSITDRTVFVDSVIDNNTTSRV